MWPGHPLLKNYVNQNRTCPFLKSSVSKVVAITIWCFGKRARKRVQSSYWPVICNCNLSFFESVSCGGYCSLTACVGREKAINQEKAACLFITQLGMRASGGGWECARLCTESTDSLDCGCGHQSEECWDLGFLASLKLPSGLPPLRIFSPSIENEGKLSVCKVRRPVLHFASHSAYKLIRSRTSDSPEERSVILKISELGLRTTGLPSCLCHWMSHHSQSSIFFVCELNCLDLIRVCKCYCLFGFHVSKLGSYYSASADYCVKA